MCGVELDDFTHQYRQGRVERDVFVKKVLENAGLKLKRIPNKRAYTLSEIEEAFNDVFGTSQSAEIKTGSANPAISCETAEAAGMNKPPICPKCGISMVISHISQEVYTSPMIKFTKNIIKAIAMNIVAGREPAYRLEEFYWYPVLQAGHMTSIHRKA